MKKIFIDGLKNIVKDMSSEDLEAFVISLEKLSSDANVDFTMIVSGNVDELPAKVKEHVI